MALGLVLLAPVASACEGLSPGDQLLAGDRSCTLAFIVANADGLYFATAGHCIYVNETASSPDAGEFGVGAFHHLVPDTGQPTDGAPGDDFGLIRIHPEAYGSLNPKMCGWDGPTGIYDEDPGGGNVRHWGHGAVFGDLGPTTQRREGYNLLNDNTRFSWLGMGVTGDSGSGVLHEDGRAIGVLTHLIVAPPDTNGGTHLYRGFALAAEAGFTDLRLVLAGEDPVEVLAQMQRNATVTPAEANETKPPAPTARPNVTPTANNTATPASPRPIEGDLQDGQPGAVAGEPRAVPAAPVGLALVAALAIARAFRRRE